MAKKLNKTFKCCVIDTVVPQAIIVRCLLADHTHNAHLSQMQVKKSCNNVSQGISSSGKLHSNVYQRIWNSKLGEVATAVRKGVNSHDHLTVAILEKDTCYTVEHLLWEISKDHAFLLKMGVLIIAKVTGTTLGK